jgi:uncharacterized protein YndB with AHSA1/START domain
MIMTIAIAVVVVLAALLAFAATKPDAFRVQRATRIKAPPERIFALINDLHSQVSWSPFEKDPNMKRVFNGAANGKGAVYEWEGNRKVGAGRIEIADATPASKVTMKLDMLKPFKAHNIVEFTLESGDESTNVTWAMHGRQPYMAKVMSIFLNCDKMVGGQFEEGLANLKTLAEK